jgi:UDPglucose 6-dehydrogenase
VARLLQAEGAIVRVYDPQAMDNARKAYPDLHYASGVAEAAQGAQVVALLTEWDQFKDIDPEWLGEIVAVRAIVDGRHALDPVAWLAAGWDYRALGRAHEPAA